MDKQELDRKLIKWMGAKVYFTDDDGCPHLKVIYFIQSPDACLAFCLTIGGKRK